MQIGSLETLSLENLSPKKTEEQAQGLPTKEMQTAKPAGDVVHTETLGGGSDDLAKVHSLDADRVAALIADPFGD